MRVCCFGLVAKRRDDIALQDGVQVPIGGV